MPPRSPPPTWNKGNPLPPPPPPLIIIYFCLYSPAPFPLFMRPMQILTDLIISAGAVFLAWLSAVAFLSL